MTAISGFLTAISDFLIVVGHGPVPVALFVGGLGGSMLIGLISIWRASNPPRT